MEYPVTFDDTVPVEEHLDVFMEYPDSYSKLTDSLVSDAGEYFEDTEFIPKTRDRRNDAAYVRERDRTGGRLSRNAEDEFLRRARRVLGVGDDEVREIFSARPLKGVRTSRFGFDPEATAEERAELLRSELTDADVEVTELSWQQGAFLFKAQDMQAVAGTDAVAEGRAFVQSPTSYMPVIALGAVAGQKILDMCAAPGGKTALIADQLSGDPELLIANELKARRLERMRSVLATLKIPDVEVVQQNAKHLGHHYGHNVMDRILADVECSTEAGINFSSNEPLKGWSRERVDRSAQLQKQIVRTAYDMLKPGGVLVYSTCSLAPEENELVIASLLDTRKTAIIQPIELTLEERVAEIRKWGRHQIPTEASKGVLRIKPTEYLEPFTVVRIRKPTDDSELNEAMHQAVNLDDLVQTS